ncbi:unnamed protein product [Mytilus coruscus]|uniref:Reverse transcriptase domain-containing protein n=1 Tax=Mytilus coruscus TaxID=42192 RepID=A0A6J8EYI5_MYTCO|nr:unnamed protein product [Mytilus coruscus]
MLKLAEVRHSNLQHLHYVDMAFGSSMLFKKIPADYLKTFISDEPQRCIQETDKLCASCTGEKCSNKSIRSRSVETNIFGDNDAEIPRACGVNVLTSPKSVRLEIKSAPKTHQYCIVSVLAFCLSSTPYLFTKCLRLIVKYWRENGVDIVLYLDDGLGMGKNKLEASECSSFVQTSLLEAGYSFPHMLVYSDASNVAAGAYSKDIDSNIFHQMWDLQESLKSSTWRELQAILFALMSFKNSLRNKCVKWHTDNNNCVSIVQKGSTKVDLQR